MRGVAGPEWMPPRRTPITGGGLRSDRGVTEKLPEGLRLTE